MNEDIIELDGFTYERYQEATAKDEQWLLDDVYEYCYGYSFNLNDTFGWALAMTDYMYADDWWDLLPLVYEYKHDAINAYFSLKLNWDVIKPLQTDEYFTCKKYIKELKDNHDMFHWFEYGEGHTPIGFKNKDKIEKDLNELCNLYVDMAKSVDRPDANERAEKWERSKEKFLKRILE